LTELLSDDVFPRSDILIIAETLNVAGETGDLRFGYFFPNAGMFFLPRVTR